MTWHLFFFFLTCNIPLNNYALKWGCHITCWLLFRKTIPTWLQSFLLDWSSWWPKNSGKTEWYEREAFICGARTEISKRGKLDTPKWNQVAKKQKKSHLFSIDFSFFTFLLPASIWNLMTSYQLTIFTYIVEYSLDLWNSTSLVVIVLNLCLETP